MKKWFKKNIFYIAGAFTGAIAGFLYWKYIGCSSGTCAITSKPLNSILYGALMGSIFLSLFQRNDHKPGSSTEKDNNNDF